MRVEGRAAARRHRGVVIICTDLEEDDDAVADALELLAGQGDDVILFHILAREEVELPFSNITHLRDSETQALVPADPRELRAEHKANVEQWRAQWRDRCEHNGILYLPIHTGMNYIDVLRGMLAARETWSQPGA